MSQENVETIRRSYAAYNAAASAPNTREAIRAVLERFDDPEIEWEPPPIAVDQQIYHGIDGVMEFFEVVLKAFEQVRQVPERIIDCGDQVPVFVRTEARERTAEGGGLREAEIDRVGNRQLARLEIRSGRKRTRSRGRRPGSRA